MPDEERKALGQHTMRLAFQHLIGRVLLALESDEELIRNPPKTLVLSGGVASNGFLVQIAMSMLQARGLKMRVIRPKAKWCTDNAPMIAFAGYLMYRDGWQTDKSFAPVAKWSIEEILTGVDGWVRRPGFPPISPEDAQAALPTSNVDAEIIQEDVHSDPEDNQVFEEVSEEVVEDFPEEDLEDLPEEALLNVPEITVATPSTGLATEQTPQNKEELNLLLEQILGVGEAYVRHVESKPSMPTSPDAIPSPQLRDLGERAARVFALAESTAAQRSARPSGSFREWRRAQANTKDPFHDDAASISGTTAERSSIEVANMYTVKLRNRGIDFSNNATTKPRSKGGAKAPFTMKEQHAMTEAVEAELKRQAAAAPTAAEAAEVAEAAEAAEAKAASNLSSQTSFQSRWEFGANPAYKQQQRAILDAVQEEFYNQEEYQTQLTKQSMKAAPARAAKTSRSQMAARSHVAPAAREETTAPSPPPPPPPPARASPTQAISVEPQVKVAPMEVALAKAMPLRANRRSMNTKSVHSNPEIKVWPMVPTRRQRDAIMVRYMGYADESASKDTSLTGKIGSVFGGWFGGK